MVRILIQRSCYKCRADLLSLLVGVRSHTLFGVSCRDNELFFWVGGCLKDDVVIWGSSNVLSVLCQNIAID